VIFNDSNYGKLKDFLESTSAKIRVDETFDHYFDLCDIVYKMNPEKFMKHRGPGVNGCRHELDICSYWFIYKRRNVVHVDCRLSEKENDSWKVLLIEIYGYDKDQIRHAIIKKLNYKINGGGKTSIYFPSQNITFEESTPSKTFDTICLPDDVKSRLITNLYSWYKSSDWYENHNLVHKTGIILYGKPGTGKTSVIRAISKMFNSCPILTINIDGDAGIFFWTLERLREYRKRRKGVIIVLFEDIDLLFKKNENGEIIKENSLQILYQMLDGIYTMNDTIYIATTNHIELLDDGLTRYGRFDIQIELPYFTREKMYEFGKMFDYTKEEVDALIKDEDLDEDGRIQPALLQSKFMEDRSKKVSTKYIKERSTKC
jgi:hypothetical protein